jgi:hypothetical protein
MAVRKQPSTTPTTGTTVPANPVVDPKAYLEQNPITVGGGASSTYSNTGVSENYVPFGRQQSGLMGPDGQNLPYYNLTTYPREFLAGMQDEVLRKDFLKNLYERGWYDGNDRPGGGLSDEDEKAVYKLLYASNLAGVQWNQIYTAGKKSPFANTSGGRGAGFRPSSTEDLVEIANRTALSTIGRKLSAEETSKFARSYQASQQAEASGGMSAPNTEVFFKNRIEQQYGAESDGYKYLSAISNVAKLMENM